MLTINGEILLTFFKVRDGFPYLGFQFDKEGIIPNVEPLIKRVTTSVNRWYTSTRNTRMKATILKSYILSQLWFFTFILILNPATTVEIEQLYVHFMWDNVWQGTQSRRVKMSKERTKVSTENGGLGLFDMRARAIAQKIWIADFCLHRNSKIGNIWLALFDFSPTNPGKLKNSPHELVTTCWEAYQRVPKHNRRNYEKESIDDPDPEVLDGLKESALFRPPDAPIGTSPLLHQNNPTVEGSMQQLSKIEDVYFE